MPGLTRLQSRLLALVIVTVLFVLSYYLSLPRNLAQAAEFTPTDFSEGDVEGIRRSIGDTGDILGGPGLEEVVKRSEGEADGSYVGDFAYFDRSLMGRAPEGVDTLEDGKVKEGDAEPGSVKHFVLERSARRVVRRDVEVLEERSGNASEEEGEGDEDDLEKRQGQGGNNQVFISVSSCRQPDATTRLRIEDPPQLKLYVSTSDQNQEPGPGSEDNLIRGGPIDLQGGYANVTVQTNNDIYIGVSAPELTNGWEGGWEFEVAASTDGYYHSYNDTETFLFLIDTDSDSALFVTRNLTLKNDTDTVEKWQNQTPSPFTMYAFNQSEWGARGLERSMCGLRNMFNSNASEDFEVDTRITTRFGNESPKMLFHVQNLTANTDYVGYLVVDGNITDDDLDFSAIDRLGAGGRVWQRFNFSTKKDDSCQVIFDLPFCTNTAYAVPSSLEFKNDDQKLIDIYDNKAREYFTNFNNSLDQVACETTGSAQYSLARNCTNCRDDYKDWLCTTLIPRCEDWSADGEFLQERNINARMLDGSPSPFANNQSAEFKRDKGDRFAFAKSRHQFIDDEIKPGPHKEILPCEDLCFGIVRSCPAQLEFGCPNEPARSLTYGKRRFNRADKLACNFPGAITSLNSFTGGAGIVGRNGGLAVGMAVVVGLVLGV